jgi:tetratricopeptide (TPR) repeat protein
VTMNPPRMPELVVLYKRFLEDANAANFVAEISRRYQRATLGRLLQHPHREIRRAAVLAVGMLADWRCNDWLGPRLADHDRGVRLLADDALRRLWMREGTPEQQQRLLRVMHLNDGGLYRRAAAMARRLSQEGSPLGESVYQLAVARFGLGRTRGAARACQAAVRRNPFHYPALSLWARCLIIEEAPLGALGCLKQAIAVCPDLENARLEIRQLERTLRNLP